jgi:hypothetical protein
MALLPYIPLFELATNITMKRYENYHPIACFFGCLLVILIGVVCLIVFFLVGSKHELSPRLQREEISEQRVSRRADLTDRKTKTKTYFSH